MSGCDDQVERAGLEVAIGRAERILAAPSYPLVGSVLLSLVALAAFQASLSYRGFAGLQARGLMALTSAGAFWAYLFHVIRTTGDGQRGLGVPDFRNIQESLAAPAFKGAVATALLWVPAVLYLVLVRDFGPFDLLSPRVLADPGVWLLMAVGLVYAPAALLSAATDLGVLEMLNPVLIARQVRALGRDYWVAVIAPVLVTGAGGLIDAFVAPALFRLPIPYLSRVAAEAASLYAVFVAARILGLLPYVRGDAIDWGRPEEYLDPVLRDEPRAAWTAPGQRRSHAPAATPAAP